MLQGAIAEYLVRVQVRLSGSFFIHTDLSCAHAHALEL